MQAFSIKNQKKIKDLPERSLTNAIHFDLGPAYSLHKMMT
jgi:hypothetical protein